MYIAGLPCHVVQRGNNREACFIEPDNYRFYLALWEECAGHYGVNAWGVSGWITPHEEYFRLGGTLAKRCHACRKLFRDQLSSMELHGIREAAHYCQPVCDDLFRKHIEEKYAIKLGHMKRGRPKTQMP